MPIKFLNQDGDEALFLKLVGGPENWDGQSIDVTGIYPLEEYHVYEHSDEYAEGDDYYHVYVPPEDEMLADLCVGFSHTVTYDPNIHP